MVMPSNYDYWKLSSPQEEEEIDEGYVCLTCGCKFETYIDCKWQFRRGTLECPECTSIDIEPEE